MVIYPYSTCKHISVGKHSQLSSLHLLLFFPLVSSIVASSACSSFSSSFQSKQSRTKFEAQIKAFKRLSAKHLFGVQSINIHKSLCVTCCYCATCLRLNIAIMVQLTLKRVIYIDVYALDISIGFEIVSSLL